MAKDRSNEEHNDQSIPEGQEETQREAGNGVETPRSETAGEQAPEEGKDPLHEATERIKNLEEENAKLKDQFLRSLADFENFRKRMFREKEEAVKYANSALLSDLIVVIDDFERAILSAKDSKDSESFYAGVTMIERQLVSMLERNWGLKRFQSAGQEFDPDRHQAIAVEPVSGQQKTLVLEDYQKGYTLHDRILRPAKVKVSQPANDGPEAAQDASEQDE